MSQLGSKLNEFTCPSGMTSVPLNVKKGFMMRLLLGFFVIKPAGVKYIPLCTCDALIANRKVVVPGDPKRSKLVRKIGKWKTPLSNSDAVAVIDEELAVMGACIENGATP